MNRAERRRNQKGKGKPPRRKQPITVEAIVGMLESSAHLDAMAAEQRRKEAGEFGRPTGQLMDWKGESYEVVDVTGGYSIGITLSAQILAGQAAELGLKYVYEAENPRVGAPRGHQLDALYEKLTKNTKARIEEDYTVRREQHDSSPGEGWKTVEAVFRSAKDYPVIFRYATEEGQAFPYMEPIFLREAVCSVMASLGINIRWGTGSS